MRTKRDSVSLRVRRVFWASGLAVMLVLSGAVGAQAKPPRWAPAHGWRSKHDPHYVGYRGHRWPDDYGVRLGRCNRAAIGAVVGGSVGGAVGSTIGKGDDRVVAVLVGTIVGAVIGHEVGRRMDDVDRSCVGHALELAALGQTVRWTNPETDVAFALTPVQEFEKSGRPCREFQARTIVDGSVNTTLGKACRARDGSWNLL